VYPSVDAALAELEGAAVDPEMEADADPVGASASDVALALDVA